MSERNLKIVYAKAEFVLRSVADVPGCLCLSFRKEHGFASWCIDSKTQPPGNKPPGVMPIVMAYEPGEDLDWLTTISAEELVEAVPDFNVGVQCLGMVAKSVILNAQGAAQGKGDWAAVAAGAMLADRTGDLFAHRFPEELLD